MTHGFVLAGGHCFFFFVFFWFWWPLVMLWQFLMIISCFITVQTESGLSWGLSCPNDVRLGNRRGSRARSQHTGKLPPFDPSPLLDHSLTTYQWSTPWLKGYMTCLVFFFLIEFWMWPMILKVHKKLIMLLGFLLYGVKMYLNQFSKGHGGT